MATDDKDVAQQADDTEGYAVRVKHNEPTPIEEQGEGMTRSGRLRPEGEDEEDDTAGFRMKSPGEGRVKSPGEERVKTPGEGRRVEPGEGRRV